MSKYSKEFKIKVVQYYLNQHLGYRITARHFNIPQDSIVRRWVKRFEEHGSDGLERNKISYDGNFKRNVIEYMHEQHLSLSQTAAHFNLAGDYVVSKWERVYYEEGIQSLYKENRGRNRKMRKKDKNLSKDVEEDLIAEVQQLRMENEYLKKLNALVQERIKQESKKK